jgi:GTP-binding protein EngB required for normal cell division
MMTAYTEEEMACTVLSKQRVVVFGSSNVGKTSMLNALTEHDNTVCGGAIGTTFSTVKFPICERNGILYEFLDTAGLNEADGGLVSHEQSCNNILNLIIECAEGFNLLILVVRIGSILQADKENFDIFCTELTNKRVPVLCVITGCENEEPEITSYAERNLAHFSAQGMNFSAVVSTCFAKGGRLEQIYQPLRGQSTGEVWSAIERAASRWPIVTVEQCPESMRHRFTSVWNHFCRWVKKPAWKAALPHCTRIYAILDRMGIKDEEKKKAWAEKFAVIRAA